jgi:PAS domain S-box-containing protein
LTDDGPMEGTILLVESRDADRAYLAGLLTEHGYRVRALDAADAALDTVLADPPDLILLGTPTGEGDRPALCHTLKEAQGMARVPILLVGDPGTAPDGAGFLTAGAADYLAHPLRRDEVLARVGAHLGLGALRAQLEEARAARREAEAQRDAALQALQQAEEEGRSLVENLNDVIYAADERGVLTYVSPAVEPFLGYHPPELLGRYLSEFIHPDDQSRAAANMQSVLAGTQVANEYRLVTTSGATRWVRTSSQPVLDGDRVVGVQGVLMDVTERKEAEIRIQRQNEFLSNILESLTHPFYVIDVEDYTVEIANSAARQEALSGGTTCYALTHDRSQPCNTADHPCPIQEIKRTKRPVTVEHFHHDAAGALRYVEVHGYPLFDAEGNLTRVIEYSLDITERKEAEEALREREREYRQLLDALQEGIWVIDQDARTTFVNPRMAEMLGYTVDEMLGQPLFSFMDEDGVGIAQRNIERRQQGIREQHDFEFLHKDGNRLYASLETCPIFSDEGRYAGAIAGVQDVTDRRRAEEALRKSESLLKETQRIAQVGGWELDLERGEVVWTEEVYRIHEVPVDYVPDLAKALSFYDPGDRPLLEEAINRAIERGEAWDLELRFVTAAGRRRWVRSMGRAERHDGKVARLSGTFQDVTERKQAEEALLELKESAERARREEAARRREAERRREIAESLAVENARLRAQAAQAAAAAERSRLARELHDSVTQALFSASLVAEILPQVWQRDPDGAREGLEELRLLTRGALAEMRTLLLELRPTALLEARLDELLLQLAEAVGSRTQIPIALDLEPVPVLPPDVQITLYRVAQEALHNVVKHAQAGQVTLVLRASPPVSQPPAGDWQGQILLQVGDDGRGFDPQDVGPDQLGLAIMRERAEAIGGSLTIRSRPDHGTEITLAWTRRES